MKMHPRIVRRIVKNALISLLIYALPVVAMFFVFYIRGERPWKKQPTSQAAPAVERR